MRFEARMVEWLDSMGSGGWQTLRHHREIIPDPVVSIGFVLNETDAAVTLLQSFTNRKEESDDMADNSICIPKFAIIAQRTLSGLD